jgi:hypothetical protein
MPLVILSDGLTCKVRRLGLFELDGCGREVLGPYRYTLLSAMGVFLEDEYVIPTDPADIPIKPDKPINELTPEEQTQLREYETYVAALSHEKFRIASYEDRVNDIAEYILNSCLDPADRNRIVMQEDWERIYQAAVAEELTAEVIRDTLSNCFQGQL